MTPQTIAHGSQGFFGGYDRDSESMETTRSKGGKMKGGGPWIMTELKNVPQIHQLQNAQKKKPAKLDSVDTSQHTFMENHRGSSSSQSYEDFLLYLRYHLKRGQGFTEESE